MLHLVLIVRRPLHHVLRRWRAGRKHGFLIELFEMSERFRVLIECSDGDTRCHGFLLHELPNLERVPAIVAAHDGVLADCQLLAARTVLLLNYALVSTHHLLPVEIVEVQQ